ncbi:MULTISPECIES: hypothetical protein [Bacillus cereus group]|nr:MULTISPECIES: hypothetical protein [Bacillus cereus group]MED1115534.1 hypothetical protein [Bacillus paramycoides]
MIIILFVVYVSDNKWLVQSWNLVIFILISWLIGYLIEEESLIK